LSFSIFKTHGHFPEHGANAITRAVLRICTLLICVSLAIGLLPLNAGRARERRLIIWSIDGFAAGYLKDEKFQKSPVWQRLLKHGRTYAAVRTTIPSITYPAHTTMVTGLEPAAHGLVSNHPVDPFNLSRGGWTWYSQDIRGQPLWETARSRKLRVANLQWPVTMMNPSKIRYHIPQFDRGAGEEESKLMRAISTPGLYDEIIRHTGVALTEHSSDSDRAKAARFIWKAKRPQLMLLYTPGLDSLEHQYGPYTAQTFQQLDTLGYQIEKVLADIKADKNRSETLLLIVSDHGFTKYQGRCFPNAILEQMGYIDPQKGRWTYLFDTAGGVARLTQRGRPKSFEATEFTRRLRAACPDVEVVTPGDKAFEAFHNAYDRKATVFLFSKTSTHISADRDSKLFIPEITGFTHGFLPERADMKTVAFAFNPSKKHVGKVSSVRDIHQIACNWLRLPCKARKKSH
jgi:hypothetical protein